MQLSLIKHNLLDTIILSNGKYFHWRTNTAPDICDCLQTTSVNPRVELNYYILPPFMLDFLLFQDCSSESPTQFEESNSIIFGDAPPLRTPLPSPSPSKVLKQAPKIPAPSCHPEWVDPLGVWLTNRRVRKFE